MDASYIIYTGTNTTNVPITANQNLETILQHIDTAIGTSNSAPNYTSFNLHCLRPTYTITNTQQFAESITDFLCTFSANYTTFSGTTYPAAISTITTAINGLQDPALTYSPFSITNTDGIQTVYSKMFTGFTAISTSIDPYTANWSTLSITPSHSVVTTWNNVISYVSGLATTVAGKQAALGTFDNSSNCLAGGATDSISTTVNLLRSYICTLTGYSSGSITWGCVSSSDTLTGALNNIISTLSSVATNYLSNVGTGLIRTTAGACGGYVASVDTTWNGLYQVMVDDADSSPDYLVNKIESTDSSITISNTGTALNLSVATSPNSNKLKVNSGDTSPDYLANKVIAGSGSWGIGLNISVVNNQLALSPNVISNTSMIQSFISAVADDPDLLSAFGVLVSQAINSNTCAAPTALSVTITSGVPTLSWTPGDGSVEQITRWRQRGSTDWRNDLWTTPNPLSNEVTSNVFNIPATNTVFQLSVLNNCSTGSGASSIFETIVFACQTVISSVSSGVITVTQSPLPFVDNIYYELYEGSSSKQTVVATGISPTVSFASVSSGSYVVKWYYASTINGVTLNSTDSSQLNALCFTSTITV